MIPDEDDQPEPDAPAEPVVELEPVESVVGGRPSSYEPDYVRQAEFLCQRGATDNDLADFFGVAVRTINRWKIVYPDFFDAIRRTKDAADERVKESLYHRAQDREVEEEQAIKVKTTEYGTDGKKLREEERVEIVTVRKFLPADTTAMIFWLKNRQQDKWRDVHKIEHGRAGEFDNMDDDELRQYIEAEARVLLPAPEPAPEPEPEPKRKARRASMN
jgi:hypothetical protein